MSDEFDLLSTTEYEQVELKIEKRRWQLIAEKDGVREIIASNLEVEFEKNKDVAVELLNRMYEISDHSFYIHCVSDGTKTPVLVSFGDIHGRVASSPNLCEEILTKYLTPLEPVDKTDQNVSPKQFGKNKFKGRKKWYDK